MAQPNEITVRQLNRQIGTPDAPAIVDICTEEDFGEAPFLIPGSFRHPHEDLDGLIDRLGGRPAVIVCQKGRKLSQGVAAWLRSSGQQAEILQGGALAWQADPTTQAIPFARMPKTDLWVTRHRPKIDRIACPWLIRRFIDADAKFLYVAPAEVLSVADRFDATAFDAPEAPYSHGADGCTFDALLTAFHLAENPALHRMAGVIRAADLGQLDAAPEAAGLLALSVGLSRHYRDENRQLEAGIPLYDALFRWARDGFDETHASDFGGAL
ncbi:MAG: chromate resistance protein ChrB domain-containing protein [Pseudomonadota bacterium]